jgi:hypothetical protein
MGDGGLRENWKGPKPTREEMDRERRELEAAGWEYVEDAVGKHLWRKPDSGRLYPQDAAVSLARGENVADEGGGAARE